MKAFKTILFAGAAIAATGVAIAQPAAQPAPAPRAEMTRDQVAAQADRRFQRLDTNRDGRVTSEELQQLGAQRGAQRQQQMAERRNHAFDRLDTDRNGQISREEFDQRMAMRGPGGRQGMRGGRSPGGRMGMAMLGQDGAITAEEFRAQALARFDRRDANRDGRIGPDEQRGRRGGRMAPMPAPQQD